MSSYSHTFVSALLGLSMIGYVGHAEAARPMSSPLALSTPWTTSADHEIGGSVFNHAAGLAFNRGSEIALGFTLSTEGEGQGDGVFGSLATSLGPLHLGVGLARLSDGLLTSSAAIRTDLGLALSLGANASIGMGWSGLSANSGGPLDGFRTWSLSAAMRPLRSLAVGIDVDGLNTPTVAGQTLPITGRLGVAFRPGTERLSLGLEGGLDFSDEPGWSVGGSLRTMLMDGLILGAYGRFAREATSIDSVEWGVNLALGQGRFGLSTSVLGKQQGNSSAEPLRVSTLLSYTSETTPSLIPPSAIVVSLDLAGSLPERPGGGLFSPSKPALADWLAALSSMARDDEVSGVLLRMKGAPNWAQCWELRQAIGRLQEAGKKVYVSLQVADMRSVYLASAADKVYLDPSGALMITGLSITQMYLAGTMEKVGVQAQFIAFEQHKTYPERFTRTDPSPASKAQTEAIVSHFADTWLQAVSESRSVAVEKLRGILREGPLTMDDALREGLVDALVDDEALRETIERDIGQGIHLTRGYRPSPSAWRRWGGRDLIAIVPVVGSIMGGETSPALPLVRGQNTGERSLVRTLRQVEKDPRYKGAVIRIDSPGGGVVASDVMYRAVRRLAKKKPVVINFGNVAASGGYYVAMGASSIIASPMTLTGSIGIFAGKADLSGLYRKLGVSTDTTVSEPGADLLSMSRPWSEGEMSRLRAKLGVYYERFLGIVAEGRSLPKERVRAFAGGRVVDGKRALGLKMIDAHGSLWDALKRVSSRAGMEGVAFTYVPQTSGFTQFLRGLGLGSLLTGKSHWSSPFTAMLGPALEVLTDVLGAHHGEPMARMPMHLEVL